MTRHRAIAYVVFFLAVIVAVWIALTVKFREQVAGAILLVCMFALYRFARALIRSRKQG